MIKEFLFRGKNLEELRSIELDEFAKLLNARQRRSLSRGLSKSQKKMLQKIKKYRDTDHLVRTKDRDTIILPEMIGAKLGIYDGKEYKVVVIDPAMIGHYTGEFALTRKKVTHSSPGFGATRSSKYVPLK